MVIQKGRGVVEFSTTVKKKTKVYKGGIHIIINYLFLFYFQCYRERIYIYTIQADSSSMVTTFFFCFNNVII